MQRFNTILVATDNDTSTGHSGLSGLVMGNTGEQILNGIECSVLAVKPDAFVCPPPN